jgi:transposase
VLNFIPARFELQVHVLPKYACSHCRDGVIAPEGPQRALSSRVAGVGLLAQVVVSKFANHLPLYRFEDISTRYGLDLPRSILCDWVRNVADLLKPLYQLQKDLVQTAPVIWTDDTHVTFLDLLQFNLNHRQLECSDLSKRIGRTPAELLAGQSYAHWLEMLG